METFDSPKYLKPVNGPSIFTELQTKHGASTAERNVSFNNDLMDVQMTQKDTTYDKRYVFTNKLSDTEGMKIDARLKKPGPIINL